jgi:hypothetical protein
VSFTSEERYSVKRKLNRVDKDQKK